MTEREKAAAEVGKPEEAEVAETAETAQTAETAETAEAGEAQLREELEQLNDKYLRLAAEYDNFRKRTARERVEGRARAQAELIRQLVDELDDLDRVVQIDPGSASTADVLEGVRLVEKKIWRQLEAAGLERVGAEGDAFDPTLHEAMGQVPTDEAARDHTVASVFQPGYRLGGMLVRPARVQVYMHQGGG